MIHLHCYPISDHSFFKENQKFITQDMVVGYNYLNNKKEGKEKKKKKYFR